ncbi:MAG: flagellar biosynthesis protein FlhF [Methylococcales bacterium]|nr:flagellar biosynthesis protein FlhF [Methylococcales bacterium]MDD5755000.1 flagellar biosynthesis protein FlhF [Methylococcales bacterium]
MKIKRFFAENIRQAMQMVREELGADAVIMSNRAVDGGVEIVAARDFDEQVVRSKSTPHGDNQPDFFKPSQSSQHVKKVDLPDFQAEKNRLHVISSPRKQEDNVFGNSTAKRGIDQYVGYAEKVQLRGNPDAMKHSFGKEPARSQTTTQPYSAPSIMIKVPKKAKPQPTPQREPLHREQMPQRESVYRDEPMRREPAQQRESMYRDEPRREQIPQRETYREPPQSREAIMPQARDTQAEVRTEARDLRQHFRDDYQDEFDEFLEEAVQEMYTAPKREPVRVEPVINEIPELPPSPIIEEKESPSEKLLLQVTKELKSLRNTMDSKLSSINFARHSQNPNSTPIRSELLQKLARMSVSKKLSIKIANRFANHTNFDFVFTQAQELLAKVLPLATDDLLETGGVIALVGPTGVGKTTSVAKLAAQFTLKHGANQVALITTDNYRIAAHEQLNTYGRILNIPVRIASNAGELRQLIHNFSDKKLILIDTAGMSQRDMKLIEQINTLKENDLAVKSYLVMSAATEYKAMNEIIDAFHLFKPQAVILTKLDEAATIGSALSSLIEHNLPLSFITNGQQVPEDMRHPSARELVAQCVAELDIEDDDYEENNEAWVAQGYA